MSRLKKPSFKTASPIFRRVRPLFSPVKRKLKPLTRRFDRYFQKTKKVYNRYRPWSHLAAALLIIVALAGINNWHNNQAYRFTPAELRLLSQTSVDQSKIVFKKGKLAYNEDSQSKVGGQKITVSTATNSTSKTPYKITMTSNAGDGIEFSDASNDLPFKIVPASSTGTGKYINGRMVYRVAGGKGVYTLRRNGVKEDIILPKAPGDSVSYRWKLELGNNLEAKLLHNGSVGIYSADPTLTSSSLQIADTKSQQLIDNARKNGKKTYLQYLIPRPYIKDVNGKLSAGHISYSLDKNFLTLTATNLKDKKYPLSIDPTVVTTTSADFATGYDDGNIDYSTADEIDRAGIGTGLVGTWHYTHNSIDDSTTFSAGFNLARYGQSVVAYNGYLYVIGGSGASATKDCNTGTGPYYCNGVQFAAINADGTIGSWSYTHASTNDGTTFVAGFITPRYYQTAVAYNGYLYVIGGVANGAANDCTAGGIYCSGVQYAPINSDGTVGAWHYTHNSTDDNTSFVSGFTKGRYLHSTVVYNGYMYIIGGYSGNAASDCTTYCKDVQFAPINANGTIGAWHYTHNNTDDSGSFVSGIIGVRGAQATTVYNGYIYVSGGKTDTSGNDCTVGSSPYYCNGIQFAKINSDGTVGSWHFTHSNTDDSTSFVSGLPTERQLHTLTAYNGYLYVSGGYMNSGPSNDCDGASFCNGVQYAPINANGTIGAWHFTHNSTDDSTTFSAGFITTRHSLSTIAYNGFLYELGGWTSVSANDCVVGPALSNPCSGVEFASLTTLVHTSGGPVGAWNYTSASANNGTTYSSGFTQARYGHSSVAYNGYLYVIGGSNISGSANDCTTGACSGVQFAKINSNGTIGLWHYTHNSTDDGSFYSGGIIGSRFFHASAIYNGYIYILAGQGSGSDCGTYCSGVEYAKINSDGTVGAWHYTHNSTDDGTTYVSGLTQMRYQLSAVAYKGYLYAIGGRSAFGATDCNTSSFNCSGILFAPINSNGTIGAWHYTHNSTDDSTSFVAGFITARSGHTSVAYNGYLYIVGGGASGGGNDCSGLACNGTQFAPINSNGTIGTWNYTYNGNSCSTWASPCNSGITNARNIHSSVIVNNYIYVIGGEGSSSANDCTATSFYCNGVQYTQMNSDGTIGTWNYTHNLTNDGTTFQAGFRTARGNMPAVFYKGYIYITGGYDGLSSASNDCLATAICSGVQYAQVNAGTVPTYGTDGAWNYTHNSINDGTSFSSGFNGARREAASLAYNGYIYLIGGVSGTSNNDCTTGSSTFYCNGVQFAKLNADGTLGSWNYTHNSTNDGNTFVSGFIEPRSGHKAVAYGGYMYIFGGQNNTASSNDCDSSKYCNGIQFSKINSDGTLGTWNYTHNSTNDGSTFVSGFSIARFSFGSAVYNGYLYVLGGSGSSTANDCTFSVGCSGVQVTKINSDGTVGTWSYTAGGIKTGSSYFSGFITSRRSLSAFAYNNYLYVSGGQRSGTSANDCTQGSNPYYCNGIQFAPIFLDGSIGTWHYTHAGIDDNTSFSAGFNQPRSGLQAISYNGYAYIVGGQSGASGNDCTSGAGPFYCNGTQFAPINQDGTIGSWHFTHSSTDDGTTFSTGFTRSRFLHSIAVYNGYVYVLGGEGSSSADDCTASSNWCSGVQYTSLNSNSQTSTYEKIIDIGNNYAIQSISFNGQAVCGVQLSYRYATSVGTFNATSSILDAVPNTTYSINQFGRYLWVQFKMDDSVCGTQSQITDFTITYNNLPAAPTLSAPANSATGVTNLQFQLRTTDVEGDYLMYKITLCTASDCSLVAATFDETSSQSGWSGQDQLNGTAYTGNSVITSSTTATYTYTGLITKGTQYWWQAYAIDPGGSNRWSAASSINSFTTGDATPAAPTLFIPSSSVSGSTVNTTFQVYTSEQNSDYVKYWIDVCSDSACNTIVRSICQQSTGTGVPDGGACTASQTGWAGQNTQAGAAYTASPTLTSSRIASYSYQAPLLTVNTVYWWRAYAVDPGGSNTWSGSSAIQSFNTIQNNTQIQGTVKFQGNVRL